jgi:hypothetical protein
MTALFWAVRFASAYEVARVQARNRCGANQDRIGLGLIGMGQLLPKSNDRSFAFEENR